MTAFATDRPTGPSFCSGNDQEVGVMSVTRNPDRRAPDTPSTLRTAPAWPLQLGGGGSVA